MGSVKTENSTLLEINSMLNWLYEKVIYLMKCRFYNNYLNLNFNITTRIFLGREPTVRDDSSRWFWGPKVEESVKNSDFQ